jgi:ubiquinone/menaquinone biosynthesis C-methylase UbiE
MLLTATQGYQIWSDYYDSDPNPLLALESRVLAPRLEPLDGRSVLDVATGTGRWMSYAASRGARPTGLDISPEMLGVAARKPRISGRLALGDARALPFRSGSVDLAICSFALSYLPFATAAFGEMARVARRVIVSDLHPEAMLAGWTRSFRSDGQSWRIEHYYHGLANLDRIAQAAGMKLQWTAEAAFDLPELPIFELAGKRHMFAEVSRTPAVFAASWVNKSWVNKSWVNKSWVKKSCD